MSVAASDGGAADRRNRDGEHHPRKLGRVHESAADVLGRLQEALGVDFTDAGALELALTHRSYAFEAGGLPTNERLEFLGDAVLGVVVTDFIFRRYPEEPEGRLAKVRAAAVNAHSLAEVARSLGLGDAVLLGRGEEQSGGRDKDSILADTLEAVLGSVYVERGMDVAAGLVRRLFADLLDELATRRESLDYKTSLQELTAARLSTLPIYHLTEQGPDHEKWFTATVEVAAEPLGSGEGRSKKEAEQVAARTAYQVLLARAGHAQGGEMGADEPSGTREAVVSEGE
ncbi:MAG: ribonuclease III [Euzebyales bacterium]|nr:ribonuclease III [Euzebyales bacterium]